MELLLMYLELLGTAAFAVSGAITGLKKGMDIFGVCVLGLTTAVGGGIIRDIILGLTPPATFSDPKYALISVIRRSEKSFFQTGDSTTLCCSYPIPSALAFLRSTEGP